ncbi:hypothetical protein EU91_0019 [Prochlorococcus marinus str. GP2]|uniref:Uncharacterized protein n=1 Tax=Prochlorococcus marinus str. GP2 TaxID=59925 RepID=A0A0A1ZLM5_PROMR|nr:hypothetical protein EU91_0019 [Prochlorococcus marinus str. GP2]
MPVIYIFEKFFGLKIKFLKLKNVYLKRYIKFIDSRLI